MGNGKKALNVLGMIVSVLLSVVLVVMLMVSPVLMSALSLLNPDTLVDAVSKVDMESTILAVVEGNGAEMDPQQVEMVSNLLATPAAKKLVKTYTESVFDAFGGKDTQGLTEEMLQQIVREHQGEIAQALRESGGEFAEMSDQELADGIQKVVEENAGEILQNLPDPQELKQNLVAENPQLELGVQLIAAVDIVKLVLIGVLVVLSLVIFFCRFVDLRGMKWLAVDLLVAGLISVAVCVSFAQSKMLMLFIAEENVLISNLLEAILGSVNTGLILRTVVMLVAAIGFLVGYILICKKKKAAVQPVAAETAEPNE